MSVPQLAKISALMESQEEAILSEWIRAQRQPGVFRSALPREADLQEQSKALFRSLRDVLRQPVDTDITTPEWETVRQNLTSATRSYALEGASPTETATSVLALKQSIFSRLIEELKNNPEELSFQLWNFSALLDKLGLYTCEVHQKGREQLISRQQQEMMELSTPVVELWNGILALPLIGTLDSQRTQVVMENLLQKIADTGAPIAIIDITGVPTVDTLVAQHLLKTIAAARLMGADCIISGIRPQIAQTIVHLGVALGDVMTKATLSDAFAIALKRTGLTIGKVTRLAPEVQ
jgi:rsbT co-antagonist protein RsbR